MFYTPIVVINVVGLEDCCLLRPIYRLYWATKEVLAKLDIARLACIYLIGYFMSTFYAMLHSYIVTQESVCFQMMF